MKTLQVEFGERPLRQELHGGRGDPATALGRIDDISNFADACLRRLGCANEEQDLTYYAIVCVLGDREVEQFPGSALRLAKSDKAFTVRQCDRVHPRCRFRMVAGRLQRLVVGSDKTPKDERLAL